MANEILGRTVEFLVCRDGETLTTAAASVSKVTDLSFSMNADEIETTSYDSAGVRTYTKGQRDMTFDFSFIFDDSGNTAQEDIISSWHNLAGGDGSTVIDGILDFSIKLEGASGQMSLIGECFITSLSYSTGMDDVQRVDCSARVSTIGTYDFLPAA